MIIRDKGEIYEVEMFHVVNIGKQNPILAFKEYLNTIEKEFDKEINSTFYSLATGQPKVQATQSHVILPD
jgi:hypothetical protein